MSAQVFLNGTLIDNSGGLFENGLRNWNRPLMIQFLPRHLQLGANELLISVEAQADSLGGLSAVEVGPASALRKPYGQRRFIQLVLPELSEAVIALVCLVTFGLWLRLRDPIYGYFTLAAGTRFVRELDSLFNDLAFPLLWDQLGVSAMVCWFAIFLALFAFRLLLLNWPRVERALLMLVGLIALALLALHGSPWAVVATGVLHVLALVVGFVGVLVLLPRVGRVPLVESLPLAAAGSVCLMLGVHDVLQRFGLLLTDTPRLSQLGAPVLIMTMSAILFSRHVRNTVLIEAANRFLELTVATKSAQLVQALQQQHQLEQQQAVQLQREHIMREMHDGVGNYLTVALREGVRQLPDMKLLNAALNNCMLDLRLMIDSLSQGDGAADGVATVLGNLRYRMEPALRAEGIVLTWDVQPVEMLTPMTPRDVLNLTRIFQEALTNVIKHAHASQVVMRFETVLRDGRPWGVVSLSDNGCWRQPNETAGHGLANMRRRAGQLEAELHLRCSDTGSTVALSLPQERRARKRQMPDAHNADPAPKRES
jgi:signal transduction histidine kinase